MIAVNIKPDKYGDAIGLLLQLGEGFQTRFEYTLIVNREQRSILERAGFIAANGAQHETRKRRGEKAK